jgi:hypothetical protein
VVVALHAAGCELVLKDAYDTGEASATWRELLGSSLIAVGIVRCGYYGVIHLHRGQHAPAERMRP